MIAFIDDHRGSYGVEPICKVLPIAPSTYHSQAARRRDPAKLPARARRDAALMPDPQLVAGLYQGSQLAAGCLQALAVMDDITKDFASAHSAAARDAVWDWYLANAYTRLEPPFLVLSDGIEDPHNLGAVMRSALLCGAHGIVIPKRGGASVTPTVIKSSAGAAERLPVARVANIGETIRRLKEQGVFVYCADMDGVPLRKNNLTGPIALVLGSEGSGVSQLVKKLCDGVVRLDMAAQGTGVDSYNVSVAAGIILYEIQSQRAAQNA